MAGLQQQRGGSYPALAIQAEAVGQGIRPAGGAGLNLGLMATTDGNCTEVVRFFRIAAESGPPEFGVSGAINLAGPPPSRRSRRGAAVLPAGGGLRASRVRPRSGQIHDVTVVM